MRYSIFTVNLLLLFSLSIPAQAQEKEEKKKESEVTEKIPLYNGIFIGADIYGLGASVFGSDFLSSEISLEVDLKNRFLPVAEIGYGTTDTWTETGIHYKSNAPYFRLGLNYNTMHKKINNIGYLYVGFRYGISSFKYDVYTPTLEDPTYGGGTNPNLEDPVWGGSLPYDYRDQKATMHWVEFLAGVRVNIYKNISMGWAFRMKYRSSTSLSKYGDPWYVPGFGEYKGNNIGITYTISYKIPAKK
nr:DUF6048 family protein [Bacteroides sp. 224]